MRPELHIEAPASLDLPSRALRLRGWCFLPSTPLVGVRLLVAGLECPGRAALPRPDVRAAFPAAPTDGNGFEVWTILPPGRHRGRLEFRDASGQWHLARELDFRVPRRWWPIWLTRRPHRDLLDFQFAVRPTHAPRPVAPERFPPSRSAPDSRPAACIVTPSFNQAAFLPETMDSVLGQGGVRLAYHVQDGASTDGSVEVIRARAGRLASWESAPDRGQADAIARAFARTQGRPEDFMAWLNSDDTYLPGALEFVADQFARHPDVDVVYGQRILIDERSREVGRWFLPPHDDAMLRLNDFVPQEALFWRRRVWDRVGGIDPGYQFAMDWDLLLRFQAAGARIVRLPYFLACFRVHPDQKTAARMESVGHAEIDRLRLRALGRPLSHAEIEGHPRLLAYLRRSAWQAALWRLGLRAR